MLKTFVLTVVVICFYMGSLFAVAQVSVLDADHGDAYYYTDHFEIIIDKPASDVWPHVVAMGTWMPWMATEDSPEGTIQEGKKVNLYGDSYIEVVKIIPQKMVLLTNLPSIENGEQSQGIAMVSVAEADGKTLVSIFMSRIYSQMEASNNTQRITRESAEFAKQRKEVFKNNFLKKLKHLAES